MGQVAFDTQEFVETLEHAGLPKDQAKAISLVVRKSHEVADLATKADINDVKRDIDDVRKDFSAEITGVKRDLEDVHKDLSAEIANVRKEIEFRFEKTDAQIADVRKDLSAQIADARKETATQIALLRKDVESISTWLLIKMAAMMTALLGIAVTLVKILI
ncbi:MAG: coiled-coil domain-containing protein [Sodalis sp. (in: enterobacteria)]|uniref:coiled-coil domain-containing protein n=1 Tax=Sodalis sp. (in: enterobacteria) TaxID=1898979 RepID=UPI0039E380D5